MPLSEAQKQVAKSNKRFRVLITGRRFGKTTLSIHQLCKFAHMPNQEVWYVAPSYRMAKGIVWRKLKKKLQSLHWIEKANESELTIELKSGSRICLKGADNYDSLRGVGIDFLIIDEFADVDPLAFYEVLRPTLSDTNGQALFVGTPKGTGNWSYDLFHMFKDDPTNWDSFTFTTLEGGFVSEEELQSARELLDERTFKQEYEASFETTSNRVWYNFNRDTHVKEYELLDTVQKSKTEMWNKLRDVPDVIYVGMDFNIDPMSAVIFARHKDTIHVIDEIEIFGSNTDEMVEELKNRYPTQKITVFPDPASRQRKTSAGGLTDLKILQNAKFAVKAPNSHNPIRDGVNAVNGKLKNANGDVTMYVDPKCRRLIECLEKHSYKEGTTIPEKDKGYDHLADAMRYYIDYEFPVRRITEKQAPQRWGHSIGA